MPAFLETQSTSSTPMQYRSLFPLLFVLLIGFSAHAQQGQRQIGSARTTDSNAGQAVGIFSHSGDVGDANGLDGSVQFDVATKTYTLKGSGANIWGAQDAFFFIYIPIDGKFEMSAHQTLMNEGTDGHRKAGIMFRETLDEDSPCILITVHGDGLTSLQCREKKAGPMTTDNYVPDDPSPKFVSLERNENKFIVQIGKNNVDPTMKKEHEFKIGMKGYVGLFVCSHDADAYERATFKEVNFKQ